MPAPLFVAPVALWLTAGCGSNSSAPTPLESTAPAATTTPPAAGGAGASGTPDSTGSAPTSTGPGTPSASPTPVSPVPPRVPPAATPTPTGPSTGGQGGTPGSPGGNGGTPTPEPDVAPEPQTTPEPQPDPEPQAQPEPVSTPEPQAMPEPEAEPEPAVADCTTPPAAGPLIGWASEEGGTTGGGDATPEVVTSAQALSQAISGDDPRVIHVNGSLEGAFVFGSNKTVIGICGAELRGDLHFSGVSNVILRNLGVIGRNCSDSPNNCSDGEDAISVTGSHHLWFDHLDVSDGSDGNLDITRASDFVTVSYTKFSYSTRRTDPEQGESGHRFSNLIGSSDSDAGEYRITWHHNWWADNVDQRMPRSRFGRIHVFNNLFTSSGNSYCTNAGFDAELLVQNNVYRGVNNPLSPDDNGAMRAEGNLFENTTGNQNDNGGNVFSPPYAFDLDATAGLGERLMAEVGPQ